MRGGDDVRRRARESTRDAGARRATRIFRIRESSVDANRRRIDRRARLTSAPTPADVLRIHAPARRGAARRAADAAHGGRRRTVSVRVPGTKRARGALLRRGTTRAHAGGAQARDGVPGVPRAGGARRGESGRTRGAARRRRRERRRRDGRGDAKARRRAGDQGDARTRARRERGVGAVQQERGENFSQHAATREVHRRRRVLALLRRRSAVVNRGSSARRAHSL